MNTTDVSIVFTATLRYDAPLDTVPPELGDPDAWFGAFLAELQRRNVKDCAMLPGAKISVNLVRSQRQARQLRADRRESRRRPRPRVARGGVVSGAPVGPVLSGVWSAGERRAQSRVRARRCATKGGAR